MEALNSAICCIYLLMHALCEMDGYYLLLIDTLPLVWIRISDMGVFSSLRHKILCLFVDTCYPSSCHSNQTKSEYYSKELHNSLQCVGLYDFTILFSCIVVYCLLSDKNFVCSHVGFLWNLLLQVCSNKLR